MEISIFTKEGFASLGERTSELVLDALTVNNEVATTQNITPELIDKIKKTLAGNMTSAAEELLFLQLSNSVNTKMLIVDSKLESMLTIEAYLKLVDALNIEGVKLGHSFIRKNDERAKAQN